jgi:hypothetical protein
MAEPEGLRKTGFGLFFVFASLRSLGFAARPDRLSAIGRTRLLNRSGSAILRFLKILPVIPSLAGRRMAEPEGFEPSIRLYNRITV